VVRVGDHQPDAFDIPGQTAFRARHAHQTIRDSERLTKLSEGLCDLNDVTPRSRGE
jgi:hypothetical protein